MTPDAPQHKPPERENEMTAKVGKIPRDGLGSRPCPCIKSMPRNEGFDPKRSLVRGEKTGNFFDSAVFRENSSRKYL
jgi:hypothetical protein